MLSLFYCLSSLGSPLHCLRPSTMSSSRRPGEKIDIAPGAATPVLDIFKVALDLVPMSGGTGLVPKALSALADRVEVCRSQSSKGHFELIIWSSVGCSSKQNLARVLHWRGHGFGLRHPADSGRG